MNNKKIGIITFHRTINFGSMLQTYGLYRAVEKLGYHVEIIDYRCNALELREYFVINKKSIKEILKFFLVSKRRNNFKKFLKEHMLLSQPFKTFEEISNKGNYDISISGSDILWGREITNSDYTYFLNFGNKDMKRITYASSVGNVELWDGDEQISKYLKQINSISFREKQGHDWLKQKFNLDSKVVSDPTMLLTPDEWKTILKIKAKETKPYVLVYFDSEDHKCVNDAIEYGREHNLPVYFLSFLNIGKKRENVINVDVNNLYDFANLLYNAKFIFTASYHGILFSTYFKKNFVFYTKQHTDRVLYLANKLGFENRLYDKKDINYKTCVVIIFYLYKIYQNFL